MVLILLCSPLCYSSDRQLSFDLVNVGRQRLDFLPMLEHSGTYRENASHTGTFAQEIITLVHFVKEQYFKGAGPTLDKRFSAPQKGGYSEDETGILLLPLRGPGDLRHDLERRRQEKLEAVKVTIPGSSSSQQRSPKPFPTQGPRRGASVRPNMGPQRWNHRFGPGRQNHPAGTRQPENPNTPCSLQPSALGGSVL
uniref:Uncharacterized protein n=1 Tax=Nothobranchius furzeri TaxID=105023 RepID=A0A8C6PPT1_NOTFU